MTPGDSDWWWTHGLDGLVGALIGGAITAFAVVATLRHERRLADLQEARALASRLFAATWRLSRDVRDADLQVEPDLRDMFAMCAELSARTQARWPLFSERIDSKVDEVLSASAEGDDETASREARSLGVMTSLWIGEPSAFDESWFRVWVTLPTRNLVRVWIPAIFRRLRRSQ